MCEKEGLVSSVKLQIFKFICIDDFKTQSTIKLRFKLQFQKSLSGQFYNNRFDLK